MSDKIVLSSTPINNGETPKSSKSKELVLSSTTIGNQELETGVGSKKGNFGKSKYDITETPGSAIQSGEYKYYRGEKQSTWDKAANGLIRFAGKTPMRAIEGILNPFLGTGLALVNGDMSKTWDNGLTNSVLNASEALDDIAPLYSTRAAENAHGLDKLTYANTLWGDILDGVSYSTSAMMSGAASTKLLSVMGKAATLGKAKEVFDKISSIEKAEDKIRYIINIDDQLKTQIKDGVTKGTYALVGATTEASDNALSDSKEFVKDMEYKLTHDLAGNQTRDISEITDEEKQHLDVLRKQVGNSSYLMNLPVIMADNWLTFGKSVFSSKIGDKTLLSETANLVEKGTDDIYKAAKKSTVQSIVDKTYGLRKFSKPFIAEGTQEQLQHAITKGTNDFYTKKYYNPGAEDFLESAQEGLAQAYGTKEGWDAFLIGAISGGVFGGAVSLKTEGVKGFKSDTDERTQQAVDLLNSVKSKDAYKVAMETIMRHSNLTEEQAKAAQANDDHEYYNKQSDLFLNYVLGRIKTGKIEDLKSDLNNFKSLSSEEFEKTYDVKLSDSQLTGMKESVNEFIQKKLDKVNKIARLNTSLDNIVPNGDRSIKDRLLYAAFSLEDAKERASKLDNEVTKIISDNTIFNPTLNNYLNSAKYSTLTTEHAKKMFRDNVKDSEISPLDQQEILVKLDDFDKLSERQANFVKEYKQLFKPSVQEAIKEKDKEVEKEISKELTEKKSEDKVQEKLVEPQKQTTSPTIDTKGVTDLGTGEDISEDELKAGYDQLLNIALTHPDKKVVEQVFTELNKNKYFTQEDKEKVINRHKELQGKPKAEVISTEQTPTQTIKDTPGEIYPRLHNNTEREKKQLPKGEEVQAIIESIVKSGGIIDDHITLSVGNNGIALIKLDGIVIGNISTYDPNPDRARIIDMVQRANKTLTPYDLGITFGLTKGELAYVPEGQELTPVEQLEWDKSITGGQVLIYDFGGRRDGKYVSPTTIGTIDESLFKPGFSVNEESIPRDLGRYVMVVPVNENDVRYIRVRPAKLDSLESKTTDKIFEDLKAKAQEIKPKNGKLTTQETLELDEFNDNLNSKFFIALDKNLKANNIQYSGYHIILDINPTGDIRVTVLGQQEGKYTDLTKVYVTPSKVNSIDELLAEVNSKLGGAIELTREDFKASISKGITGEEASKLMIASTLPQVVGKKKLLWSKADNTKTNPVVQTVKQVENNVGLFDETSKEESEKKEEPKEIRAKKAPKTKAKVDKAKDKLLKEIEELKSLKGTFDELSDEYDEVLVKLQEKLEEYRNKYPNNSGNIAYRINGTGKPLTQSEIDEVKQMLPPFISIELFEHIIDGLRANGIPMGVFKDMVIKLNTSNAVKGTGYHEAFHSIFRTVLTEDQITTYLQEAEREYKSRNTDKKLREAIDRLRSYSHEYQGLSVSQLEQLVYEEYMADKFMEFKKNSNEKSFFRRLFIIIKDLLNLFKYNSEKLSSLFEDISTGAFVNQDIKDNRFTNTFIGLPVFKLLPAGFDYRTNEWTGEEEVVKATHSLSKSLEMVNTLAAIINHEIKAENKIKIEGGIKKTISATKESIFDAEVQKRINNLKTYGNEYVKSLAKTNRTEAVRIKEEIRKELQTLENEDNLEVLKDEVLKKLSRIAYEVDITEEEVDQDHPIDEEQVIERFGSMDSWLKNIEDSLPKAIKEYIGFTTYLAKDELTGRLVEKAIDARKVYNGLSRILADTPKDQMIQKLYLASKYNPNIKAVLEQLMSDTGITVDDNSIVSSPTKNINDYNMFLNAFDNSKTQQLFTLHEKKSDSNFYTVGNANTNDSKKVTMDMWANQTATKASGLSATKFANKFSEISKEFTSGFKKEFTDEELDSKVDKLYSMFDDTGLTVSKGYIEYSLLALKQANGTKLNERQSNLLSVYEGLTPITKALLEGEGNEPGLKTIISQGIDPFSPEGITSKLTPIAEANGLFDESIGDSSFKNAEGKSVFEIIKKSYVLDFAKKLKSNSFINKLLKGEDKTNDLNDKNYKFIKDNYLLKNFLNVVQNLKVNIIDGIRSSQEEDGVVFGKFDQRTYLAQALAFFASKTKSGNTKYIFRQNEASNTAYVAELPFISGTENNKPSKQAIGIIYDNFLKEFNRIKREKENFGKGKVYKGYNEKLTDRAFDFTEFKYLEDVNEELYKELKQYALDGNSITEDQKSKVEFAINQYLEEGIQRFKENLDKYGLIKLDSKDKTKVKFSNFLPTNLLKSNEGRYSNWEQALEEFYINDYIMSSSLNELMDGDYAISRKDKTDITKRNKGAMGSGNNYGSGTHKVAYIKDINTYVVTKPVNGNLIRVKQEGDKFIAEDGSVYTKDQVSKINSNDAQSYQSITHKIFSLAALGRYDNRVKDIYNKILRLEDISEGEQEYLESVKASLNPDKTVTFGMGVYHKTSEHSLVRGMISYVEDKNKEEFQGLVNQLIGLVNNHSFDKNNITTITKEISRLYKPIPGMEYWHNLANNMDTNGIDQVITESASKGATLIPVDSQEVGLDLTRSMTDIPNEYKRLQVETPTGKDTITAGTQLIQLIDSEQSDSTVFTFPDGSKMQLGAIRARYRDLMNQSRVNSFKAAITYIKDSGDGTIDKTRLDSKLLRSLEASGADETLLELFAKPYNFNMSNMVDKAEQIVLAHFSRGVLSQHVNGSKVSLVSDAGIEVLIDEKDNVIPYHLIKSNPSKYANSKRRKLKHNKKYSDGVYSECMLSERILTKHGLKVGDEVPQELLKSLGYRIPTQDKHSMMAFKIVGLLPNYMEGTGIFPQEIVHLSGADFDIDSEFLQTYAYWLKNGKPVKYGTEKTDSDKWEAFIYYKTKQDKEFKIEYKNALKNFLLNNPKGDIKEVLASTLEMYGLPTNEKEFSSIKQELNNATINNKVLDLEIAMLTNEHMLKDIAYTPAGVDAFEEATKKIEDLKKQYQANKYTVKENNLSASDINGKFLANTKNSAGKQGIGIVANKSQVFTFLAKASDGKGTQFDKEAFKFNIGGAVSQGYKYLADKGRRIADTMSTLLSVMTDNAKDPKAGRIGLNLQLLSGFNELIAQGMNEYKAGLVINQPIIQTYGTLRESKDYALQSEIEKGFSKNKTIMAAISQALTGDFILYKQLKFSDIVNYKERYIKPITQEDLEKVIRGEIKPTKEQVTKEELDNGDIDEYTRIQLSAILQFTEVESQADNLANINILLKLNKGLETSFNKLSSGLIKAIKALKLQDMFNININQEENQLEDINNEDVKEPIVNVGAILKKDPLTKGNVDLAINVLNIGEKIFISQTDSYKKALSQTKLVGNRKLIMNSKAVSSLERNLLSFFSIKGYMNLLQEAAKNPNLPQWVNKFYTNRILSISPKLVYPSLTKDASGTLASQLLKLKGSKDILTKNNLLVRYLTVEKDVTTGVDLVKGRSFVKESPETIKRLVDAYKELFNEPKTQRFAIDMFNYLLVKDNLEFRNNTFIKYIAPFMFEKLSEALDVQSNELSKSSPDFSKVFGESFDQLSYNFRKLFVTNINNKFKVKYTDSYLAAKVEGNVVNYSIFTNTKEHPDYQRYKAYIEEQRDAILSKGSYDFRSVDKSWEKFPALGELTKTNRAGLEGIFGRTTSEGLFIFPQFMRIGNNAYELIKVGDKNHDTSKALGLGIDATYIKLDNIGTKVTSPYYFSTYEEAKAVNDQVEANKPIENDTEESNFLSEEDIAGLKESEQSNIDQLFGTGPTSETKNNISLFDEEGNISNSDNKSNKNTDLFNDTDSSQEDNTCK